MKNLSQKKVIETYNSLHLGDNLIHLNYLHRLSIANPDLLFKHYVDKNYISKLCPLLQGIENIELLNLQEMPHRAVNSWIGDEDYFYNSPLQTNWVDFHLDFFKYFSERLGLNTPIIHRDDLLFDFPALHMLNQDTKAHDFLIINSTPLSGQTKDFDPLYLTKLTQTLVFKGFSVITTHPTGIVESTLEKGFDLLKIAQISFKSSVIIGIPNGPMWLTFNKISNKQIKARLAWVSIQNLDLGENCLTCLNKEDISKVLQDNKII